jgi:copper oxidase (laccase) domain-containing protein
MNLSFSTGDELANIKENFRRWCTGQGVDPARTVMVGQTHTTNVIYVDESHCGEGLERDRIQDVDGMITDRKGIALITSHADCVPLYFYDPVHEAIGLAHAGWRGTVGGMAAVMLEKMGEAFAEEMALAVLEGKEDKADSIEVASLKYLETLSEKEAERFCDALDKKFDEVMNF